MSSVGAAGGSPSDGPSPASRVAAAMFQEGPIQVPEPFEPTDHLKVTVRTIEQHFSGELSFHLPWFQRAYAWGEEHALRLLHDIIAASQGDRGRYVLGQVLLAREPDETTAALIDGHQRTLTLTIIFALLRDQITDIEMRARLDRLIKSPLEGTEATDSPYRVRPQKTNIECFAKFVQEMGATRLEPDSDLDDLLESERNFLNNRNRLSASLQEHMETEAEKCALAEFLLSRCILVVQTVDDDEEAWEMLSVEETTGLAFHSSERSKIALITVMRRDLQDEAGRIWDSWQARLGADGMAQLLRHIRAMKRTKRSNKPIEQDLIELYELEDADLSFINDVLVPHAQNYLAICKQQVGAPAVRSKISASIDFMQWLARELWVPPALRWIQHRGADDPETPNFFALLDRLAWLLRIAGRDPIEQERRFRRIGNQIKDGVSLHQIEELRIEARIRNSAAENLTSRTFYDKSYSRLVLRRISVLLGKDSGLIDGDRATVEHVLPRRPPPGSAWYRSFNGKKSIGDQANRLGNLAILSFSDNQTAGAQEFEDKRQILQRSGFVLSEDVAGLPDWTPAHLEQRTQRLAATLYETWNLTVKGK